MRYYTWQSSVFKPLPCCDIIGINVFCAVLTPVLPQNHPQRRVYLRQAVARGVPSVALTVIPANAAVVLVAVLGSRLVVMPAIQASIIHGSKESVPAKGL